ncbi:MAG TPA: glycosyltransferase family 2 protein [Bacteroidales bacterium]|nr:glycosyltransferase family 2 protein [Bacteroidales bacterium]
MLSNNKPSRYVSIIMPCRNEEKHISACLDSVLSNDYPKGLLEIIVIDGTSDDSTRELVDEYIRKHPFIRLLHNPDKITPKGLNIGITNAKGDIIMRMDVHSRYCSNYISTLVHYLDELNCDNVGGMWITKPSGTNIIARAIAVATSLPFGIGDAWYRIGENRIRQVDTVPYGCYRKKVFKEIGYFDEDLIRNQDDEFNARLIKNGGKIYLIPEARIEYYARESLNEIIKMFYQYGFYKPLVNIKVGKPATIRQLIPPLFVLYLLSILVSLFFKLYLFPYTLTILAIYFILNILNSLVTAIKEKDIKLALVLPIIFCSIHLSYGFGYIAGLVYHPIPRVLKRNNIDSPHDNRSRKSN